MKRVLIVDDEIPIAETLAEHAAQISECAEEIVPNGADALTAVARARPGLVLLDMNMPGAGLEVLQRRSRPASSDR